MRSIRIRVLSWAVVVLTAVALTGCGGDDESAPSEPSKVYVKTDSTTLKHEGTAVSPEEKARRKKERERKLAAAKAGQRARKIMAKLQGAKDEFDTAELIAGLGEIGSDAARFAKIVEPYLTNESAEVRAAAIKSLAKLRGAEAREAIEKAIGDSETKVAVAALHAWRIAKLPKTDKLFELLKHYEPKVQFAALECITRDGATPAEMERVMDAVADFDGPTSRKTITIAVAMADKMPKLADQLVPLLDHPDGGTRVAAIQALGKLKAKSYDTARKLVEAMADDDDPRVCRAAHDLMKAWGGGATPAYDPSADPESRQKAAEVWENWLQQNRSLFSKS